MIFLGEKLEEYGEEIKAMLLPIFKSFGITMGLIISLYMISRLFPQQTEVSPEEIKDIVVEGLRESVG